MFEKAKQDLAIARDIPRNVQIMLSMSLATLCVAIAILAIVSSKARVRI